MSIREDILTAASTLLEQQGLEATSTRAICGAAGVTAPTLYHYFGDKEGVLAAVVAHGFEQFLAEKRATLYSHDPVENLRRGWDTYVAFGVEHPALYALIFSQADRLEWPEAAKEGYGMLLRLMGEVQLAGLLRVDLPLAAQMYWSAVHGVTSLLVARPHFAWQANLSEQMREAMLAVLLVSSLIQEGDMRKSDLTMDNSSS